MPEEVDFFHLDFDPGTYLTYHKGVLFTGESVARSRAGVLMEITAYLEGRKHGTSRGYFPDGSVHSESAYEHGEQVGAERMFHENGQLRERLTPEPEPVDFRELDFDPGTYLTFHHDYLFTGESVTRSRAGVLMETASYQDGLRHGPSRGYYPDGSLYSESTYDEGQESGASRTFYENGQLREQITYEPAGYVAKVERWDEDGDLTYEHVTGR
ncbi:hypothetical protein Lfu02_14250 [Longispora fulva]|uniref:Antitoxin component YwqK of YwqJK toxin-antitoxin module n=1 Tax=Longispora fulva TaxID=619741 RepID=A0A8J7KJM1_9ACTN|nr:hypothetical protein [Longispora fulva]MBG6140565.1 antitoxin component YwqK of YwqJK toxin-antitoxin module [Longispora fulva]GIG57053.1 hypothetical protein Lfu02_14250 [Longispora fulva]